MMLKVSNLSFSYGLQSVLRDIDFSLSPGTLAVVLGTNGSGKSTLLKNINRLLKPDNGTVTVDGIDVAIMSRHEIARQIGYMPQKSTGVQCSVFEAVLLGRKARLRWDVSRDDLRAVERILGMIGLETLAMRQTTELSGGELQKVVIARALAQEPKVLLLDEPINHLDMYSQLEVMKLLKTITETLSLVSLVVTHDLNSALRFAHQFIFMRDGRVCAYGGQEVMTTKLVKEVFQLDAVIEEVVGIPVVVPLADGAGSVAKCQHACKGWNIGL